MLCDYTKTSYCCFLNFYGRNSPMNNNANIESILKELIVDWDDLAQPDYNPLKNALELNDDSSIIAANFRNFYHKIDSTMSDIIKDKYKGFNDSVLIYTDINKLYHELNKNILDMIEETKQCINSLDLDVSKLEVENSKIKKRRKIQEYAVNINELYKSYAMYEKKLEKKDYEFCTGAIINVLECDFDDIEAVKEMKSIFASRRKSLLNILYKQLEDYIYEETEIKNEMYLIQHGESSMFREKQILSYVVQLNGLLDFDNYVFYNIKFSFFSRIENAIKSGMSLDKIFVYSVRLFFTIMKKLWSLSYSLNMKHETNFYGEKYSKLKIFCENGQENVKQELMKEWMRFILNYSKTEKPISKKFDIDNLVDIVSYDELYENKYKIYERMVAKDTRKKIYDEYTLIKKPSVKNIFMFYDCLEKEFKDLHNTGKKEYHSVISISSRNTTDNKNLETSENSTKVSQSKITMNALKHKYRKDFFENLSNTIKTILKKENKNLKYRVVRILTKDISMECDYKTRRLFFLSHFLNYFKPFKSRIVFLKNFTWSFEFVIQKFKESFGFFFKSPIICNSVNLDNNNTVDCSQITRTFKEQLLVKSIVYTDLASTKVNFEKIVFSVLSLKDLTTFYKKYMKELETIDKDLKAEQISFELNNMYKIYNISLSMEISLNIFYFFEKFYKDNDRSLGELFKLIVCIKKSLQYFHKKTEQFIFYNKYLQFQDNISEYFVMVFDVLNHYIIRNTRKLKINSKKELKMFIKDLKNVEEMLYGLNLGNNVGFDESYAFFESVLNNKCDTEEGKILKTKINL